MVVVEETAGIPSLPTLRYAGNDLGLVWPDGISLTLGSDQMLAKPSLWYFAEAQLVATFGFWIRDDWTLRVQRSPSGSGVVTGGSGRHSWTLWVPDVRHDLTWLDAHGQPCLSSIAEQVALTVAIERAELSS